MVVHTLIYPKPLPPSADFFKQFYFIFAFIFNFNRKIYRGMITPPFFLFNFFMKLTMCEITLNRALRLCYVVEVKEQLSIFISWVTLSTYLSSSVCNSNVCLSKMAYYHRHSSQNVKYVENFSKTMLRVWMCISIIGCVFKDRCL